MKKGNRMDGCWQNDIKKVQENIKYVILGDLFTSVS